MNSIIQEAEKFVLDCLNENLKPEYVYHNFKHTKFVVSKIEELIKTEKLNQTEKEIVILAGWFHDIGYTIDKVKHEDHSITIATNFFLEKNYNKENLEKIVNCIKATKLNEKPLTILENILCDADFSHLASSDYKIISKQLRNEFENIGCGTYTNKEWLLENITVFNNHKYYTKYANLNWNLIKSKNLTVVPRRNNIPFIMKQMVYCKVRKDI